MQEDLHILLHSIQNDASHEPVGPGLPCTAQPSNLLHPGQPQQLQPAFQSHLQPPFHAAFQAALHTQPLMLPPMTTQPISQLNTYIQPPVPGGQTHCTAHSSKGGSSQAGQHSTSSGDNNNQNGAAGQVAAQTVCRCGV